jgi:outer membrane protein OmpA-like peptidoglycan-associated protein
VSRWLAIAAACALAGPVAADSSVPGPHGKREAPPKKAPRPSGSDRDGDGIPDSADKCPDDPEDLDGFEDADGCPDPDNDKDGIPDVDDLCPNDPEDRDGFEDEDGCPDPDNDQDRIPDKDDKCPNEPETYNGFEDDDGCPDKAKIVVTTCTLAILDRAYFRSGEATIGKASEALLKTIADTLRANPEITRISVDGHSDSVEEKRHPGVGRQRAEAVAAWLRRAGVPQRIEPRDFAASHPISTNATENGRSKNRRIEFTILERSDGK